MANATTKDLKKRKAEAEGSSEKESKQKTKAEGKAETKSTPKIEFAIDKKALKRIKLVAVAYSYVEREMFATEDAYIAEVEVQDRAQEVLKELEKLKIPAKSYPANQYFIPTLLVDDPEIVLNLVDTLRGSDLLQTTVPAALELANIPYTGAGMQGLVVGNNRQLTKQLLKASEIPTPDFQFIRRSGTAIQEELGLPLIVKLNEGGGSVGINATAIKETYEAAQEQVNELISTYKIPVVVERFVDGREINAIIFDDGKRKHVFLAEKAFQRSPDGKHYFQTQEDYNDDNFFKLKLVEDPLASKITSLAQKAFTAIGCRDYAKFDIRVDQETGTPYFTDCNPNTAFGPGDDIPFTQLLKLYGLKFEDMLASLMSKYAKRIE